MKKNKKSSKKRRLFKWFIWSFLVILLSSLLIYLIFFTAYYFNVPILKTFYNKTSLVFLVIILFDIFVPGTFILRSLKKILNSNKKNSILKNVNSNIEGVSTNRWLHNEQLAKDSKVELSLEEFHLKFGCDSVSCKFCKEKNKNIEDLKMVPGWVISAQYRNKNTNVLIKPPLEKDYIYYNKEEDQNLLDTKGFQKASEKWKESLLDNNNSLVYHSMNEVHTIAIGATGSGKTQKIIFPGMVRNGVNLPLDKKPTMIITDPKGEIFNQTSGLLEKNGYCVKVLNFRTPTSSSSWNPMALAFNKRYEAINFKEKYCEKKVFEDIETTIEFLRKKEVQIKKGKIIKVCFEHNLENCSEEMCKQMKEKLDICFEHNLENCVVCILKKKIVCTDHKINDCNICIDSFVKSLENNGYFEGQEIDVYLVEGEFFLNKEKYNDYVDSQINTLIGVSEKALNTLAGTIIPVDSKDEFWPKSARELFVGIACVMLELMDLKPNEVSLEKFNVPSVLKIMTSTQDALKKWVNSFNDLYKKKLGKSSVGYEKLTSYLESAENTSGSISLTAKTSTREYAYAFVQSLLCDVKEMINLEEVCYGDKPYAVYLIVPDDDNSFHPLAAAFVDQLYKTGIDVATQIGKRDLKQGEKLYRQMQFYLDEFGNMPKLEQFETKITVARSRNIFFMIILQDYKQLDAVYGKDISTVIKGNCNGSIYIKTNDLDTAKLIADEYGKKSVIEHEIDTNDVIHSSTKERGYGDNSTTKTVAQKTRISEKDIITPNELINLEPQWLTVKKSSTPPVLLHSLYSYQIPEYREHLSHPIFVRPNISINFDKNHYFNFLSTDINDWFKDEVKYQESESSFSAEELGIKKEDILDIKELNNVDSWEETAKLMDKHRNQLLKDDLSTSNNKNKIKNSQREYDLMRANRRAKFPLNDKEKRERDILSNNSQNLDYNRKFNRMKNEVKNWYNDTKENIELNYEQLRDKLYRNKKRLFEISKEEYEWSRIPQNQLTTKEKERIDIVLSEKMEIFKSNAYISQAFKQDNNS